MCRFESERQNHIAQYGSFLYCPERNVLCFFMEEKWKTGCDCRRMPCVLDDLEDIALKKRQKENLARRHAAEKKAREEEEQAAPIRRQTRSPETLQLDRIHRLEEESRLAYRRNRPNIGEAKLHEAMMLRRDLRQKKKERII